MCVCAMCVQSQTKLYVYVCVYALQSQTKLYVCMCVCVYVCVTVKNRTESVNSSIHRKRYN